MWSLESLEIHKLIYIKASFSREACLFSCLSFYAVQYEMHNLLHNHENIQNSNITGRSCGIISYHIMRLLFWRRGSSFTQTTTQL